jgi:hypothetical protein
MARYNTFQYGDVTVTYGAASASVYEAVPFTAEALDYDQVKVSWITPGMSAGNFEYTRLRVVRNQDYPSETQEDGVIIVDLFGPFEEGTSARVTDGYLLNASGEALPLLQSGRYVYYSIWILKTESSNTFWDKISDTSLLLARSHDTLLGNTDDSLLPANLSAVEIESIRSSTKTRTMTTHQKFLELLPKVYTTSTENPLDVVDENSDLSIFLKGFTYTLDEFYTYLDLLLPSRDAINYSPDLLRAKTYELGYLPDSQPSVKIQQKLVREAFYMHARKGTAAALQTFAESMTGFDSTINMSVNMFLSAQDSTFYKGIGSWLTFGGCTITSEKVEPVPSKTTFSSDISKAIDFTYSAKVVTSAANAQISNGNSSPITKGIPVSASTAYTFSAYVKNSDSGTVTPTIRWYDVDGAYISSTTTTAWTTSSSWAKQTVSGSSPSTAKYAGIDLKFNSGSQTYYLDMLQFAVGAAAVEYREAREAEIYLYPNKINYIPNPSFETNKSSWTITDSGSSVVGTTGTPISPDDVISGYKSLSANISTTQKIEAVVISGSKEHEITTGFYYTFSFYAKTASGVISATATLKATSGLVSTEHSEKLSLTEDWKRYQVKVFVSNAYPAPTLTATLIGRTPDSGEAGSASGAINFDSAQLERAYSATDYFDGSMVINGGEWSGTANNSASFLFPKKATVLSRLAVEMPSYVVTGSPYQVVTSSGIVSGNMGEVKGFAP